MKTKPTLGQEILINRKFIRTARIENNKTGYPQHVREWVETELKVQRNVIVIGQRTLSDGLVHYEEEGLHFEPKSYVRALLVVGKMNEKPFYVPASQLDT